jgi:hypothetical protein
MRRVTLSFSIDIARNEVAATNVIGILEGSDPHLKNEAIVIGAHYDHLGRGGDGGLAPRSGEIHHGADDNASGVAACWNWPAFSATIENREERSSSSPSAVKKRPARFELLCQSPVVPLANVAAMVNYGHDRPAQRQQTDRWRCGHGAGLAQLADPGKSTRCHDRLDEKTGHTDYGKRQICTGRTRRKLDQGSRSDT